VLEGFPEAAAGNADSRNPSAREASAFGEVARAAGLLPRPHCLGVVRPREEACYSAAMASGALL
jgi:hypothetical protein